MSYVVLVLDNFHFMDRDEEYELPPFDDAESALQACRKIVDEFLEHSLRQGVAPAELYDIFGSFGETPLLRVNGSPPAYFSASDYARLRCAELCADSGMGARDAYADTSAVPLEGGAVH